MHSKFFTDYLISGCVFGAPNGISWLHVGGATVVGAAVYIVGMYFGLPIVGAYILWVMRYILWVYIVGCIVGAYVLWVRIYCGCMTPTIYTSCTHNIYVCTHNIYGVVHKTIHTVYIVGNMLWVTCVYIVGNARICCG